MTQIPNVYRQVVRVSYVYLGPAADRFISRQITHHLQRQPDTLQTTDLPELIDWIRLAMSFLTDDQELVNDYAHRLQALQRKPTMTKVSTPQLGNIAKAGNRTSNHAASA